MQWMTKPITPFRGVMMGGIFMSLDMSDFDSPITFMCGSPYEFSQDKSRSHITVY